MLEDYATICEEYLSPQIPQQQQQVVDFNMFEEDPGKINERVCVTFILLLCLRGLAVILTRLFFLLPVP